jgi:hypothetical protein
LEVKTMRRGIPSVKILSVSLTILATILFDTRGAAAPPPPITPAAVKPDQALLYLIRPHGPIGGNGISMSVYANEELIASIKGDAYSTAYISPGRYVIWIHTGLSRVLEFVPGQKYYIRCALDTGVTLMAESEGEALIAKAPNFMVLKLGKETKARERGVRNFPKVKPQDYEPATAALPASVPANTEGLLHIAAYSPIELELMETVSSAFTPVKSRIWFRVKKDAVAAGEVWLRAGTPVAGSLGSGQQSRGGGAGGVLEIEIPEVTAAGGVGIPVVGQVASAGTSRIGASTAALAAGGFLGMALVKGREAFHLPGTGVTVFTRAETWVKPAEETPPLEIPDTEQLTFVASLNAPIHFSPGRAKPSADVTVSLATAETVADIALVEVDGWTIPSPPKAIHGARAAATEWIATFRGWDLIRHLRAARDTAPVRFAGHLTDGRAFTATGAMNWVSEE